MKATLPASEVPATSYSPVRRWRWEILAIVLALTLQLIYFTGFVSSDDGNYVRLVNCVRDGQTIPEELHYFVGRFVHWGALLLAVGIWPRPFEAVAVVPMLATFGTFFVIWAFARRHLSPRVAPPALFIFGLTPIVVVNASVAVPDPLAMVFGWTGVYLAAGALLQRETSRPGLRCLAAGLLIAIGYNAKESTMAMVPGLMLFVLLFRTRCFWAWKRAVFLGLGAGFWLTCEMIVMGLIYGNPFFHKHAITIAGVCGPFAELTPAGLLYHWTNYLRWLLNPRSDYSLMGPVLLAGIIYGFLARKDTLRLLLCVIMPIVGYLSLGSSELFRYVPLAHQSRYLLPILPGMALLAADMFGWLWQRGSRTRPVTAAAAAVVLAASLWAPNRLAGKWYYADIYRAGYHLLTDHQSDLRNHRLCAAQITLNRFFLIPRYLDIPEVEVIDPIPMASAEWREHYAGTFILTSPVDHRPVGPPRHAHRILTGIPYAELRQFRRVARYEPPRDRIGLLMARLLGRPTPTNPAQAVELWYIPATGGGQVASVLPKP